MKEFEKFFADPIDIGFLLCFSLRYEDHRGGASMINEKLRQLKEALRIFGTEERRKRKTRNRLVKDLQGHKITAKQYAETTPIVVKRKTKETIVGEAMGRYQFLYGDIQYEEIKGDFDRVIVAIREYSMFCLCDLREDYYLVKGLKGESAAFRTLTDRTIAEIEKIYPWISDEYYME